MMRQKILHTLLAASFGALAMTATAQYTAPATAPAPVGGTSGGMVAPANPAVNSNAPAPAMDADAPRDMSGYKAARTACDKEPAAGQEQCRTKLNTRYSSVAPKCQKLSGSALDDCLKGADTGK